MVIRKRWLAMACAVVLTLCLPSPGEHGTGMESECEKTPAAAGCPLLSHSGVPAVCVPVDAHCTPDLNINSGQASSTAEHQLPGQGSWGCHEVVRGYVGETEPTQAFRRQQEEGDKSQPEASSPTGAFGRSQVSRSFTVALSMDQDLTCQAVPSLSTPSTIAIDRGSAPAVLELTV